MEEQRQRQEDEQRRALAESDPTAAAGTGSALAGESTAAVAVEPNTEEAMLQRALALSTETPVKRSRVRTLFAFYFPNTHKIQKIGSLLESYLEICHFFNSIEILTHRDLM